MANRKKSLVAVAVAVGVCAGVLIGSPAGAQDRKVSFLNKLTSEFLGTDDYEHLVAGQDGSVGWVLKTPPGAAAGVYQIEFNGSAACLKAEAADDVRLAPCAANPGKPQRWKVNLTPGSYDTIESRMYPGQVLTNVDGSVVLRPIVAEEDGQKWTAVQQA
ncbi:hypothetical protein OHT52_31175 [Streptomyces sp. NBC_00247]|uniref:hypothetical protein n=1 Tax=Streptomyces sp. NBC_00247 TaxID=2975689 RepID=UPI002E2B9AFC|nr:hypothetical protein [Streptomyces sp. NBC_00247]